MLDQQWLRFVLVLCLLSAPAGLQAGYPVVGRGLGTLAIQAAPDADWRVISAGCILPAVGEARTAATGSSHLHSDHGTLSLGSLSQVHYDLTARQATLLMGRVFCAPSNNKPWTILAAKFRVIISGSAEVFVDSQGSLTVTALQGHADITLPGSTVVKVAERNVCVCSGVPLKSEVKPLTPEAEQSLIRWTTPLPPSQGMGQLVIGNSQNGRGTRLNIARYHAEVVLQPPLALVKLDQSFYNPSASPQEGEFVFNLPPGAAVSRFATFATRDQLIDGEIIERRRLDEDYTTTVHNKRDPATLEQIGDNLFKMRVFPIPAKDVKRILFDFTLPLEGRGGQYQLQLPWVSDLLPIWDFRLFGTIRGPTPLASVQCPTHPEFQFALRGANEIAFDFERQNYQPVSDLVIAFQQPSPENASTFRQLQVKPLNLPVPAANLQEEPAVALHPDGSIRNGWGPWNSQPGTYFQAELPTPGRDAPALPADVLVLIDTSGNGSLDQVRPALQTVLASLRPDDRFRLVCVDVVARPLHDGWLTTRAPAAVAAYQKFEQQICLGATNMQAACQAIVPQFANHGAVGRPIVIYIGDGLHSVDDQALPLLAQHCAEAVAKSGSAFFAINTLLRPELRLQDPPPARTFSGGAFGFFQFGPKHISPTDTSRESSLNAPQTKFDGRLFLTELTRAAGGRCFDFTDAQGDRGRLFEWLLSGVATPTRIKNFLVAGCEDIDLYHPANLLPGEPFRIVGRKLGTIKKLEISYQIEGADNASQPQKLTLSSKGEHDDFLVGRHWAAQRLRYLQRVLAAPPNGGGQADARKLIVELSREWSLLTPHTAFLVLETEDEFKRWNVPRQGRRRYWPAQNLPHAKPLPGDWVATVKPINRERTSGQLKATGIDQLDRQLAAARQAFEVEDDESATRILNELAHYKIAVNSQEYRNLRLTIAKRRGPIFHTLGIKQAWFDPDEMRLPLPAGTDQLLGNIGAVTTELLHRHPLAEQLLQEISLPPTALSVFEFSQFLRTELGINVYVDAERLAEESVDQHTPLEFAPLRKVSGFNAIHHVLDKANLTVVEEPHRLVITTKTEGSIKRQVVLFPVHDLLSKNPTFDFDELEDPLTTRDQAASRRIETKLKKLTSIHLKGASLDDLADRLRQDLDENILFRNDRLEAESIATDATDISCEYDNVSMSDALTWILNQKNLTYVIDREALTLTTKADTSDTRPVRVYSGHGLLYRSTRAVPGQIVRPPLLEGARMGWGGGSGLFGGGCIFGGIWIQLDDTEENLLSGTPLIEAFSEIPDEAGSSGAAHPRPARTDRRLTPDNPDTAAELTQSGPAEPDEVAWDILTGIQEQTGGPPDSPWMDADGEGGSIQFFYPSLSFVIRQTEWTHLEIAEFFARRRALQARHGTNPNMVLVGPRDALSRNELDVESLSLLIQTTTGGQPDAPWMEADGEGGTIAYDRARMAFSIRQTSYVLDEIRNLLLELRRERFALLNQSRPWEQSVRYGPQHGLFDAPWLMRTADPAQGADLVQPAELNHLQVRRNLAAGHWKWTDNATTSTSELTLSTAADRLNLTWRDWEARLQSDQSSVSAPHLRYAELGAWGDELRDWLDVKLVFWPHRSNQELARLFQVLPLPAAATNRPQQVRLQFTPANVGKQPVWLQIVYDKATGLPVVWEAFHKSALVQRFTFQSELTDGKLVRLQVRQESVTGQLLGTGEWTPIAENVAPLPDPLDFPKDTVIIDRRPQSRATVTTFETGWQLLRKGKNAPAAAEFRKVLDQHPTQPLAQFLLAWSLSRQPSGVSDDQLQAAYRAVLRTGPPQLARSLARLDAGRLSERQLYDVLQTWPVEKREPIDDITLGKLALQVNLPAEALRHAHAAWDRKQNVAMQRFDVSHIIIESQLRQGNLKAAGAQYDICRQDQQLNSSQLVKLLEPFELYNRASEIPQYYQELLQRQDPSMTVELRRSLLKKYAEVAPGIERWQTLLTAIELLPVNSPEADSELDSLAGELTANRDPAAAAALALLAKSATQRQKLQCAQANLTPELPAAQKLYWQLHQAGFLYRNDSVLVSDRLIEAHHPEQAVAILEALARSEIALTKRQRIRLAKAYTLTDRPLDAQRAISE